MAETVETKQIVAELKAIRKDLEYIKEHMIDADTILTPQEEARHEEGIKAYREGKAISLKDLEKEMQKQHV